MMDENAILTSPIYQRIYAMVRQIPSGSVASYGQIARVVGGCTPRMVGYALAALRSSKDSPEVPWQRVINSQGRISPHGDGLGSAIQHQLLEEEGIQFSPDGVIDFDQYGWIHF
jgi:methylated-DNA-protein-cysteine methyltransferase related protein